MEYKEIRSIAVDFAYYVHLKKLGDCSHEKHKEIFDEWAESKVLPQADVIKSVCAMKGEGCGNCAGGDKEQAICE